MAHAHTTRRHLVGASAAMLLLGCTAAGDAKAAELDGELLAACERFHAANWAAYHHAVGVSKEDGDALHDTLHQSMQDVLSLIPRTPEGLQAKAGVAFAALMSKVRISMSEEWRAQADVMETLALDVLAEVSGRRRA